MGAIYFRYVFLFHDRQEVIDVLLDSQTLNLIEDISEELPSWTNLDFHQCPNCSLTVQTHPNCPVAVHLLRLVKLSKSLLSYDMIGVDIISPERVIYKVTTAQKGISSLMGLIMATSSCPHLSYLKPMARFHLPFANMQETVYRACSMYLLAQYFLQKQGSEADLELDGLSKIYQNIQLVNEAMAGRFRNISDKNLAINALILLDIFAKTLPHAVGDSLKEIRHLFVPYLRKSDLPFT
jgi:hypothetical protein